MGRAALRSMGRAACLPGTAPPFGSFLRHPCIADQPPRASPRRPLRRGRTGAQAQEPLAWGRQMHPSPLPAAGVVIRAGRSHRRSHPLAMHLQVHAQQTAELAPQKAVFPGKHRRRKGGMLHGQAAGRLRGASARALPLPRAQEQPRVSIRCRTQSSGSLPRVCLGTATGSAFLGSRRQLRMLPAACFSPLMSAAHVWTEGDAFSFQTKGRQHNGT
mmetsp:Transcript_40080/g.95204  ORF Transcript_40080/g.95204 Transcript_40080/m.95204 type:complete len:216 (-) Transcript_40080:278-925(-)